MRWGWIVVGASAMFGAYWLSVYVMIHADLRSPLVPWIAHAIGAFAGGAVMLAHAPLRPWREPVLAAALCVATMCGLFLGLPHFDWFAERAAHPSLVVAGVVVVMLASACGGAYAMRAISPAAGPIATIVLAMSASLGMLAISFLAIEGVGSEVKTNAGLLFLLMLVIGFAVGFGIQTLVEQRRIWLIAFGSLSYLLVASAQAKLDAKLVAGALVGAVILAVPVAIGARVAWARRVRRGEIPTTNVPPAQVR